MIRKLLVLPCVVIAASLSFASASCSDSQSISTNSSTRDTPNGLTLKLADGTMMTGDPAGFSLVNIPENQSAGFGFYVSAIDNATGNTKATLGVDIFLTIDSVHDGEWHVKSVGPETTDAPGVARVYVRGIALNDEEKSDHDMVNGVEIHLTRKGAAISGTVTSEKGTFQGQFSGKFVVTCGVTEDQLPKTAPSTAGSAGSLDGGATLVEDVEFKSAFCKQYQDIRP